MTNCFLIGNGPSQNNVRLRDLKGTTFCVNDISPHIHDGWFPGYWFFQDLEGIAYYTDELRTAVDNGTRWVTFCQPLTINQQYRRLFTPGKDYDFIKICGGATTTGRKMRFNTEPPFYSCGTTLYVALQYAWWKGFRKFGVIGVDSRDARPADADHYYSRYNSRLESMEIRVSTKIHVPKPDAWGLIWDFANAWVWENGGSIYDVSDGGTGCFKHMTLEEFYAEGVLYPWGGEG